MKRLGMFMLLLGALAFAGGAGAADGRGDEGGPGGTQTFGPYTIITTDGGSCGNSWANDTIRRSYSTRSNGDGTYTVFETNAGTFVTLPGESPGKCGKTSDHGQAVNAGVHGVLGGYLTGTVYCTGQCVLNRPAVALACPTSASPCTRSVFIAAAFGPTARWSCLAGPGPCRFRFDYFASDQGLIFHHWTDQGTESSPEQFTGDIANA